MGLRRTVEEYRKAFSVIPEEDRKRIVGLTWGSPGHGEERSDLRFTDIGSTEPGYRVRIPDCCPLGAIAAAKVVANDPHEAWDLYLAGNLIPNPRAAYVNETLHAAGIGVELPDAVVEDFIADWDDWVMTDKEMEAIFS